GPDLRDDEDELAAVAPGVEDVAAGQPPDPPAVAVLAIAEARGGARFDRRADPVGRDDLLVSVATFVQEQFADTEHVPWAHRHLVAAQVDALWIARPGAERDVERIAQGTAREGQRVRAGCLRQDRRQQVGRSGAVDHRTAGWRNQRLIERGAHPVPALYPRAVVPVAR